MPLAGDGAAQAPTKTHRATSFGKKNNDKKTTPGFLMMLKLSNMQLRNCHACRDVIREALAEDRRARELPGIV